MMICLHFFWYFKLFSCFFWVTKYAVSSSHFSTLPKCRVRLCGRLSWRAHTAAILCWCSWRYIFFQGSGRSRNVWPVRFLTRPRARRARSNWAFLDFFLASCTISFIVKFLSLLCTKSCLFYLRDGRTATLELLGGSSSSWYLFKSFLASLARLMRASMPILPSYFFTNFREILPHLHTISKLLFLLLTALRPRLRCSYQTCPYSYSRMHRTAFITTMRHLSWTSCRLSLIS